MNVQMNKLYKQPIPVQKRHKQHKPKGYKQNVTATNL